MIEVKNITKRFGKFEAVSNVTCNIEDGCIYGMVGSNGAGKSTFLRILAGIYRADEGEIRIDDKVVFDNPEAKKEIMFVADELFFLPNSNLDKMAAFYRKIYKSFDDTRYEELLGHFKLDRKKGLSTFSKGMRRQAAVILALSVKCKYMFFDETFDGLDPIMRNFVKQLLCECVEKDNTTVIITSHSLRELEDVCDHLTLLHKGGLVVDSDVFDLKTMHMKVQIAFNEPFDKSRFDGIDIKRYRQMGSVANMIISGEHDECVDKLKAMKPTIMDVLPLTLEEVFTFEMEALGYKYELEEM